jgi:hypothetical protein
MSRHPQPALHGTYWAASLSGETHPCICGCGIQITNHSRAVLAGPACRQRFRRKRLDEATAKGIDAPECVKTGKSSGSQVHSRQKPQKRKKGRAS